MISRIAGLRPDGAAVDVATLLGMQIEAPRVEPPQQSADPLRRLVEDGRIGKLLRICRRMPDGADHECDLVAHGLYQYPLVSIDARRLAAGVVDRDAARRHYQFEQPCAARVPLKFHDTAPRLRDRAKRTSGRRWRSTACRSPRGLLGCPSSARPRLIARTRRVYRAAAARRRWPSPADRPPRQEAAAAAGPAGGIYP